jgi:adenylate cyclase
MKKLEFVTLLISAALIGLVAASYHYGLLDVFENKTYDLRFTQVRGTVPHSPGIAIIAIDEASIREIGRFPWSRRHYVPLLDHLSAVGARGVLMDAFFPEAEDAAIDASLADAIARAGNVVLATAFEFAPDGTITGQTASLPAFTSAAMATAQINFLADEDGVNRYNKLFLEYGGQVYPSLGMMGAFISLMPETLDMQEGVVVFGDRRIPVDQSGRMLINHRGPPGTYETFSFADIAAGRVDPARLKDRIFFLGATALGIYDMRMSPFHHNTPGVEVNAAIADTIIRGEFISRGLAERRLDYAFMVLLSAVTAFATLRLKSRVALPVVVLLVLGYSYYAISMFLSGRWVSVVYPLVGVAVLYSYGAYMRFMIFDRSGRQIRQMFSSYVSPKVVERLMADPDAVRVGGDSKDVTVLFTDVRGYTSFSESRTPHQVVQTLNEYLGAMAGEILDFDGTLDKFLGDGIMAYWGAPLPQEGHATMAVTCLLGMRKRLLELHRGWEARGEQLLTFRAGLHSGEVVAGNIGALGRKMEYTVIGDPVNLASRLEATGKAYGVDVILSEATLKLIGHEFLCRELDVIRVVGKKQPIRIFELVGLRADFPEGSPRRKAIEDFERALAFYRARRFVDAVLIFAALSKADPEDKPPTVYLGRCESFARTAPPEDWDGVYDRRSK